MVGEPNMFSILFNVRPDVGMAIRRNKMRISQIGNGIVLSFCVHSMPQQFVQYDDEKCSETVEYEKKELIELMDESQSMSPTVGDLPPSFDLNTTSEEEMSIQNANGNEDSASIVYLSDDSNGTARVRELSHFEDFNYSSPSPSAP